MRMKRSTTSIVRGSLFELALQKKQPSTGDEGIEKRNAEISAARKHIGVLLLSSVAILVFVTIVILAAIWMNLRVTRIEPTEGEFLLAISAENALLEQIEAGDVVQFYAEDGQISSMRYVMVASISDGSLMVLVDEMQMQDYLRESAQRNVAVLPVIRDNAEAATQAIAQQRQWNAPEISLALSGEKCTLEVGQSIRLDATVTVTPDGATRPALCWESSDEAVVTVGQDGTLTAVSAGTATVTATCGEEEKKCVVTVLACADSMIFDAEAYDTSVGQTLQLPLVIQPENTTEVIRWESSDETIATVDASGVVTAHAGGSVTITATGSRTSASCIINVSVPAESIVLNSTELQLTVGSTGQLAAVVMPDNASDKSVHWSSSDEAIVTVWQDGKLRAAAAGTATITATCGDATATCTVTVTAAP